jgi:hypothetical protein
MELAEKPPLGELSAIPPVNIQRFQPVLPPTSIVISETGPLIPVGPIVPIVPPIFPPGSPPGTPGTPPSNPPVPPSIPPTIPPGSPPISAVPEPNAVYLFLVTFVVSLYGLTRFMPEPEKRKAPSKDKEAD